MPLSSAEITQNLQTRFGHDILLSETGHNYLPTFTCNRQIIADLLGYLKQHPVLQFNFLTDLCGVHYPQNEPDREFCVVYHLHSWINNIRIKLKVFCAKTDCKVPSATAVFPAANWMERETFDFFGIEFEGHPNLKRILNVDEMDFFPMRKEYPLEEQTRTDKNDKMFGRHNS
ncbi:NADH-quinone oxidoreductase subunit C [Sphingobacteriales bacterium UPWRP_1]|nr:NADH-quinone oxidoreductase subunit C [Sphingobacteriales bacterium TSM_CSS]PSJ74732.1 NADH-quinone oxidoreductase subunit C [Sphingobacteriales bacterium UPWRP_1]